jgi:ribosomal protein S18 acetylase RimI-like enzyme
MQLRPARAQDANGAGHLIINSATSILARMCDVNEDHHSLGVTRHAFTLADGQFGYANHWVIELDDEVAAITSAWHTELTDSFHQATLHSIVSYYGLEDSLEVIKRCQLLKNVIPPPKKDEWCIGHFAVSPSHQRKGLGTELLAHMQTLAALNGKTKLSLDVELHNQVAINFYLDSGFVFTEKPTSRQIAVGNLAAHGHMFLPI